MVTVAQVVAAVAGGALVAIAAMAVLQLYAVQRRAGQEQKIQAARRAVLDGVETFRQTCAEPEPVPRDGPFGDTAACRGHLRLVDGSGPVRRSPEPVRQPQAPHVGRAGARADRSGPARSR